MGVGGVQVGQELPDSGGGGGSSGFGGGDDSGQGYAGSTSGNEGGDELTDRIYDADYAEALPVVSATAGVRKALVDGQRAMARDGVVMAGRDIGTVVFPHADHKFFLTASLDEKVRRRAAQFERRGEAVDGEAMRREVAERDRVDSERPIAPLKPAADAIVIDTDYLDLDEVVNRIVSEVRASRC